ncbi:MAG: DUF2148 domain-containing protein [Bacteroidales bacterium]|nr:DUF2148 domain-containing protein [Bacteroidales bacterium]
MIGQSEKESRSRALLDVADKMLIAARTAPKTRGRETLSMKIVASEAEKVLIATKMKEIGIRTGAHFFERDAKNLMDSEAIVLFGSSIQTMQLPNCGLCGYENCTEKEKHPDIPCAYNPLDLGIAIGSAVSIAMDNRVDNRVMYTVGMAILELNLLGNDVKLAFGIPLSATSKNIFFDRK